VDAFGKIGMYENVVPEKELFKGKITSLVSDTNCNSCIRVFGDWCFV
jgi:hypothetical protein